MKFSSERISSIIIFLLLFSIPFIWFGPNEMDLGGDSSRLYFYDPLSYLLNHTLYSVSPSGYGEEVSSFWGLSYIGLLYLLKQVFNSPSTLIKVMHGLALSLSFLFVTLSLKELFSKQSKESWVSHIAASIAGMFYVFSPRLIIGWDKVIMTHSQIFINSLMFYLLLRYFKTSNFLYILIALVVSFLFAHNFSYASAPPFFAFFPISLLFLLTYATFIVKKKIIWRHFVFALMLFLCLHAFHIVPQILSNFQQGSVAYTAVFSEEGKFTRGLSYFMSVAPSVKVSTTLMGLQQMFDLKNYATYGFIVFPFILLLGIFSINKREDKEGAKTLFLTTIFFLITTFLVSANITNIGFTLYKLLFNIPGFSMFRNYFGQWQYVYVFFYALLLGQCLYVLLRKRNSKIVWAVFGLIVALLVITAKDFIGGSLVNKALWQSKDTRIALEMDPEYEKFLSVISEIQNDSKILTLPLADPGYQILSGINNGAYQGPSTIAYLTGKSDFVGLDDVGMYGEGLMHLVKNNDISGLQKVLSIMNVGYIFHNEDERIYDESFPGFPYEQVRTALPVDQKEYKKLLSRLELTKHSDNGDAYQLYSRDKKYILPHFYVSTNKVYADNPVEAISSFAKQYDMRTSYHDSSKYSNSGESIILMPNNISSVNALRNNYHLHTHSPFVSQPLDSFLYPIIELREKQALDKLKDSPDAYVDLSLLHLAKRIAEIEKWKNLLNIDKREWQKTDIIDSMLSKKYASWEAGIDRYSIQANDLISWINMREDKAIKNKYQIMVFEQLIKQQPKIKALIQSSNISDNEKQYLYNRNNQVFNSLYQRIKVEEFDPSVIEYSVNIPKSDISNFTLYVSDNDPSSYIPTDIAMRMNDEVIQPTNTDFANNTLQFENINLQKGFTSEIQLIFSNPNLVRPMGWRGKGVYKREIDYDVLLINKPENNFGMYTEVAEWSPNTQYIITFDYLTHGKDFLFTFYERKSERGKPASTNAYFDKHLNSTEWKKHQTVITSDRNALGSFLSFRNNEDKDNGELWLRDIQVKEVKNPKVMIEGKSTNPKILSIPKISFIQINPTKYIVQVKNAKDPYTLVFLESFNSKWKVLYDKDDKVIRKYGNQLTGNKLTSYFNSDVSEGVHTNSFLGEHIFSSWSLPVIADSSHELVNGYANAWTIKPSDVENKNTHTLVIEMTSQRTFYVTLAISLLTLILLVIGILFKILKRQ